MENKSNPTTMNDKILQGIKDEVCFKMGWIDYACFLNDADFTDKQLVYDAITHAYHERMKQEAKAEQKHHLVELTRLGDEPEDKCFNELNLIDQILKAYASRGSMETILSNINEKANQYAEERIRKAAEEVSEHLEEKFANEFPDAFVKLKEYIDRQRFINCI